MASENVLTHPFLRPGTTPMGAAEIRREAASRTASIVLMAALHILFFLFFVFAVHPFDMSSRPIIETILTLPLPGNNQPRKEELNPQILTNAPPRINAAPITIPKPPPVVKPDEHNDNSNTVTPGDILGAVGRELACSAGSWEHLTQAERRVCLGQMPWRGARLPNGSLVMVPRNMLPRLRDPSPDEDFRVTGADKVQRDVTQGPPCPILQNTPCLHPSMNGGGFSMPLN